MPSIEPFIRWAGGKTWLIDYIQQLVGNISFEHYHEPFLGGGAVFFSLDYTKRSYLSDTNQQLINTYIQVRDNPQQVLDLLAEFENTKDVYYKVRDEFDLENNVENAARFIFLNQTSFNGIFRVNKKGRYNVPYGYRYNRNYDINRVKLASRKLKNTRIEVGDFEANKYRIQEHDLVFLDPPYTVSHNNNGFIEYNQDLFSLEDQYRLSSFIDYIKRKDAYYILTNAAHETVASIFEKGDRRIELGRPSLIGGKNAKRQRTNEYIFTNIPGGEKNE